VRILARMSKAGNAFKTGDRVVVRHASGAYYSAIIEIAESNNTYVVVRDLVEAAGSPACSLKAADLLGGWSTRTIYSAG